ncbi:hypothetical protein [Streptomyces sp. NPDC057418]|uniref:hypothetical protein n=1 Tax=Streptomyces sp. NPDC057418 TaxID=3346126 RepID=UPI00367A60AF
MARPPTSTVMPQDGRRRPCAADEVPSSPDSSAEPLVLVDVVRAASGRIISFTPVEVTGDPDVGIKQEPPSAAPFPEAAPAATPDRSVPPRAARQLAEPGPPLEPATPAADVPAVRHRRLPQRRSRHDGFTPAVEEAPTTVTSPGSPEDAGDWMEQFFEGGGTVLPSA